MGFLMHVCVGQVDSEDLGHGLRATQCVHEVCLALGQTHIYLTLIL